MNIVPNSLKPLVHRCLDKVLALTDLYLPDYYNLKTKVKYLFIRVNDKDIEYCARKFLKEGDCVFDVGANVGLTARAFSSVVGRSGKVFAVEPEMMNFSFLCANTLRHPAVEPVRMAFSSSDEDRVLYLNPISGAGNSFYGEDGHKGQAVRCATFDQFCEQNQVQKVHIIKIDVEGAELEVLGGLNKILEKNSGVIFLIEMCPPNLERAGESAEILLEKLRSMSLHIGIVDESSAGFSIHELKENEDYMKGEPYINIICSRDRKIFE